MSENNESDGNNVILYDTSTYNNWTSEINLSKVNLIIILFFTILKIMNLNDTFNKASRHLYQIPEKSKK